MQDKEKNKQRMRVSRLNDAYKKKELDARREGYNTENVYR